ncbi:MAG: DUF3566 domain-containing protein [Mycobacterium sp.]|nr:DUF3566 domain-containing protein [Mycobacterium sp.]
MSSPKEPGYPRAGEGPGGANGSASGSSGAAQEGGSAGNAASRGGPGPSGPGPTRGTDSDVPPWQRGPAARAQHQQPPDAPPHADGPRGNPPGLDARLNRFISGGSTSAGSAEAEPATRGDRTDVVRAEAVRPAPGARSDSGSGAYASELPDLSGPPPRPPQRKPADRPSGEHSPTPAAKAPASGRGVQVATRQHRGPVRASMQIRRIDPWSALKVSLVLSVAMFFVWMIAVAFLYLVLGGMGVWSKLNSNVGDLLTSASGSAGGELVSSGTIFGGAALIGLVNIVLMTAAATIGAFIYNLTTDLVGGVEVTLADRD